MNKRKIKNLKLKAVKVASLTEVYILKGGGPTIQSPCNGQTNGDKKSEKVRNCKPAMTTRDDNCISDDC